MYDMTVKGIGEPRGRVPEGDTALTDQEHLSGRAQEVPAGVAPRVKSEPCAAARADRENPLKTGAYF
jgi:hypothetical protein